MSYVVRMIRRGLSRCEGGNREELSLIGALEQSKTGQQLSSPERYGYTAMHSSRL